MSLRTTLIPVVALVAVLASAAPAVANQTDVPTDLAVPTRHVLFMQSEARGVQIYTCQARTDGSDAFEWAFLAPEAELLNSRGDQIGKHFAGPRWEGNDGSQVVGMARAM